MLEERGDSFLSLDIFNAKIEAFLCETFSEEER